ncbi:hypothetical protein VI817_000169 [Penicillium citrinum]|nr:hypothetical protein VI817_000169 [Penicillium citrinum]
MALPIWQVQKEKQPQLECAVSAILSLETQDGMPSDVQCMASLITLLILGFEPSKPLKPAIKQMLYQGTGFLDYMMAHDEFGPLLETRLQKMGLLSRDNELKGV